MSRKPGRRVPCVVCIDVEPDEQQVPLGERKPWTGFETALEWMQPVRDRLAAFTGQQSSFGWFLRMDHQIEVNGVGGWSTSPFQNGSPRW